MKYSRPRGTQDIGPPEIYTWRYVERVFEETFARFGYASIRTPIFESTDLFIRYLRPIKVGPARAVAQILRTGKRSVVVQVDIYRANDDEVGATATVNFAAVD